MLSTSISYWTGVRRSKEIRSIRIELVHWILRLVSQIQIDRSILFPTVNIIDRYLIEKYLKKEKPPQQDLKTENPPQQDLFLIAGAALLIASKIKTKAMIRDTLSAILNLPHAGIRVEVDSIRSMEFKILENIKWDLGWSGPITCLNIIKDRVAFSNANKEKRVLKYAMYFLEMTLIDVAFLAEQPLTLALASFHLGVLAACQDNWVSEYPSSGFFNAKSQKLIANFDNAAQLRKISRVARKICAWTRSVGLRQKPTKLKESEQLIRAQYRRQLDN